MLNRCLARNTLELCALYSCCDVSIPGLYGFAIYNMVYVRHEENNDSSALLV